MHFDVAAFFGRYAVGPGLPPTVLVVEDEYLVRDLVAREISEAGFGVVEAETAEEGLRIIEEQAISLLFTDIRLPGSMDGWGLAEQARKLTPDLPVIYATGYSDGAPRLVSGGVFLRKPYVPSAVIEHIRRLTEPH
jgi:CheY-like chemotaxis protein